MKIRELLAILHADGWTQVRMRGSHRQLRHPKKPGTVTVAGRPGVDMPPGTLNAILKVAGLKTGVKS
jgi:predicted RNA binding protein YcfA (HicA-like mRNA interferase family)